MMGSRNMMIEGERRRRGKFEKDPMVSERRICGNWDRDNSIQLVMDTFPFEMPSTSRSAKVSELHRRLAEYERNEEEKKISEEE